MVRNRHLELSLPHSEKGKASLLSGEEANAFVEVGSVVAGDARSLLGALDQLAAWYK